MLKVRAMSRVRKKELSRQAALWSAVVLGGLAVLAGLALGIQLAGQALFSRNDRFKITNLDIRDDGGIAAYFIRERKGIAEGTNLFSFSVAALRRDFLKERYAAKYKSIEISRVLPGTLVVSLLERVPLARVGEYGNLVADREGRVFGVVSGSRQLPAIAGSRGPGATPGGRLQGSALAALSVIEACDDPRLGIAVDSVDASEDEYLVIRLKPGARYSAVKLAWKAMRGNTRESLDNLRLKLRRVSQMLSQQNPRQHATLDATYEDRFFGGP